MPWGAVAGAVISAGMQGATASGAFDKNVPTAVPTRQEYEGVKAARDAYNVGRKIQQPLDALAREDLQYLGSNVGVANAGSQGVNQFWRQAGPIGQQLAPTATLAGPGSGRFWGQMGQGANALGAGIREANVMGRLGGLNQYMARSGQFLTRRARDLDKGLGAMVTGGAQSAQNQMLTIQNQMANNAATAQAMGGLGGAAGGLATAGINAAMRDTGPSATAVMDSLFT